MREVLNFVLSILGRYVQCFTLFNLGGFTYAQSFAVVLVLDIFVSSLVISFRKASTSPDRAIRLPPVRRKRKSKSNG